MRTKPRRTLVKVARPPALAVAWPLLFPGRIRGNRAGPGGVPGWARFTAGRPNFFCGASSARATKRGSWRGGVVGGGCRWVSQAWAPRRPARCRTPCRPSASRTPTVRRSCRGATSPPRFAWSIARRGTRARRARAARERPGSAAAGPRTTGAPEAPSATWRIGSASYRAARVDARRSEDAARRAGSACRTPRAASRGKVPRSRTPRFVKRNPGSPGAWGSRKSLRPSSDVW